MSEQPIVEYDPAAEIVRMVHAHHDTAAQAADCWRCGSIEAHLGQLLTRVAMPPYDFGGGLDSNTFLRDWLSEAGS